jgi:hypothetical protein
LLLFLRVLDDTVDFLEFIGSEDKNIQVDDGSKTQLNLGQSQAARQNFFACNCTRRRGEDERIQKNK